MAVVEVSKWKKKYEKSGTCEGWQCVKKGTRVQMEEVEEKHDRYAC